MASHKRPERVLRDAKHMVEDCLREGYFPPDIPSKGRGAHTEAQRRLADKWGVPVQTARDWILATRGGEFAPDYTLFRPYQYVGLKDGKRVLEAYQPSEVTKPEGNATSVAFIGDTHDSPALPDKSRFEQMGKWVADKDFDICVQIGDFCSLDSMTRHAAPGTKTFADLPSFKEDLESLDDALNYFDLGLRGWAGQKIITLGNHEFRAYIYEDNHPQMSGLVVPQLHDIFRSHGWRIVPYGEISFIEGVGVSHSAINTMGKAYGGKTADSRTGNDSIFSFIHGHTHQRVVAPSAKIGPMGHVDIVSIGCALPQNHVEDYAKHGPSGWWWGVTSATLQAGRIMDLSFKSMDDLERHYG